MKKKDIFILTCLIALLIGLFLYQNNLDIKNEIEVVDEYLIANN